MNKALEALFTLYFFITPAQTNTATATAIDACELLIIAPRRPGAWGGRYPRCTLVPATWN